MEVLDSPVIPELEHARTKPYAHQIHGIQKIIDNPIFFLADEMGVGKSLQAIYAAIILHMRGEIDNVLVVCPAAVRSVWFNQELGEIAKHVFLGQAGKVIEYHAVNKGWWYGAQNAKRPLQWTITNYEFIRSKARLEHLRRFCGPRTFLIIDESTAVKNHRAEQTKSVLSLRKKCGRVLLLNGTPIANSPLDMYSQGNIMDPRILNCASFFHFRSKYAIMGGWQQKQIMGWVNLEDIQNRFKPYMLRRMKRQCLDLPPVLPPVTITVPLSAQEWYLYKEMRDELVAWLDKGTASTAAQAPVKVLRLAQITSGFLGGLIHPDTGDDEEDRPAWIPKIEHPQIIRPKGGPPIELTTQEIGRAKLDAFLALYAEFMEQDPKLKVIAWCRFRPELFRVVKEMIDKYPKHEHATIMGGQKTADRAFAERLLDPRTSPDKAVFVAGTYGTGSLGLNLTACHTMVNISYDYSLYKFLQSQARVDRIGQTMPVSIYDIVATGPNGQKTIDHSIVKARQTKENVANWTTSAWISTLLEE